MAVEVVSPGRFRTARLARGLTQTALAKELGCSPQFIQQCEAGKKNPVGMLPKLVACLGFPRSFFLGQELSPVTENVVSFRRRRASTASVRSRTVGMATLASECLSPTLRQHIEFDPPSIPDLSRFEPEAAAAQLREHWNLGRGPIANMVHLLEAKGVEVYFLRDESPSVDALCFWKDVQPYVLLNRAKLDGARARYDAAHELGHLVLHQGRDFEDTPEDVAEGQADRFASAFLLPAESFATEVPTVFDIQAFSDLRLRWRVSIQAMVRRSYQVGVFSKWQYENAFIRMSSLGWRSGPEPGAPDRETSFVHEAVLDHLADIGIRPHDLAAEASLTLRDLASLMPVAERSMGGIRVSELIGPVDTDSWTK